MTKKPKLERVEVGGLLFDVRPGTSDIKAINEVVKRRGYARRNFVPEPGEHWIDLGGHVGAFSVWASSQGATVTAYEADPEACELLEHNAKLNGMRKRVNVVEGAVVASKKQKTATLHRNVANGNTWRNSIEREWRGEDAVEVACVWAGDIWRNAQCVKMDIEGSEMPILERYGARALDKLVFEWTFDVDPSLTRFEAVVATLRATYDTVRYAGYQPGYDTWQSSWFPPCRIVWCQ